MKKPNQITAMCDAYDRKVESTITELMYKYDITPNVEEYPNIAIGSEHVLDLYNTIANDFTRHSRPNQPNTFMVVDFGIGIGNASEIFIRAIAKDRDLGGNLSFSVIAGFDRELYYIEYCRNNLNNLVLRLQLEVMDLTNKEHLEATLSCLRAHMDGYSQQGKLLPIMYCNRPLRDLKAQFELEYAILESAPVGTYLITPMGSTITQGSCDKEFRMLNNSIIKKTGKW